MLRKIFAAAIALASLVGMAGCGASGSSALSDSNALVFCKRLAKENAEYGWEESLADTSFEHENGNVVVIFRNSKLGNAFGGQQRVDVQCVVSGTNDAPKFVSFDEI